LRQFKDWSMRAVRGKTKIVAMRWHDSEDLARRRETRSMSAESVVKLLSKDNLFLLRLMRARRPASMAQLARLTGRKTSNLSRTLRRLEKIGVVTFSAGPNRTLIPRLTANSVKLEVKIG
jgi:predicted transcriptional regulator